MGGRRKGGLGKEEFATKHIDDFSAYYEDLAKSLVLHWNDIWEVPHRVFGNHHQALIGLFCDWWLGIGKKYDWNTVLLTGVHAGRATGRRAEGNVADSLFGIIEATTPMIVGVLEVEVGAQRTSRELAKRTKKCLRSFVKHKKEFPDLQWCLLFGPDWRRSYVPEVKRQEEVKRIKDLSRDLNDLSQKTNITIFNCLAGNVWREGGLEQAIWDKLNVSIHQNGKGLSI